MAARHERIVGTLKYPKHAFNPTDLLNFIYLDGFEKDCSDLGLEQQDIDAIKVLITAGGRNSPVIQGTGGLRKMRFAPESWNCGKSRAARVCFVYFEEFWTVLLVSIYRKSQYDNISASAKKAYRSIIKDIELELERQQRIC